ncbi:FkbM family methyltransferase [bacterium]|nr:FkbM family methyltransferase [bacterium]
MKSTIQRILQKLLGFDRYLWYFTLYKLKVLHQDQGENHFFHFLSIINKNATVLDIGANLGLMSYYLSKDSKINKVLAFEPMPDNLKILRKLKDYKQLNNLEIHAVALGEREDTIELVMPLVDGVRKQGLSHVKADKIKEFNSGHTVKAAMHTLDNYLKDLERLDAIKIDVENYEYEVFLGAKEILSKHKPLIYCELWDNQNRQDCFNFLKSLDYEIHYFDGEQLQPYQSNLSNTQNFFFLPKTT